MNVISFFERLASNPEEERLTKYVAMGRRNAGRMLCLINDLLDIEKIKSGNMNVVIKTFEIRDSFFTCEETSAATAEEAGVILSFTDNKTLVSADQGLIDRVLTNLVSNAIRYSPRGKSVSIACEELEGFARISVTDEGQGIPVEELSSVFERFRQAKSGGAKDKGGSGLGLAICKSIIEMHGGKIWAVSPGTLLERGSGSTFYFTLPLARKE